VRDKLGGGVLRSVVAFLLPISCCMVEPAADRHSGRRDGGGRGEGMSVDTDWNFVTFASGLACSIAYLERQFEDRYWAHLWRDCKGQWVDE
jgi:hypothetical protein